MLKNVLVIRLRCGFKMRSGRRQLQRGTDSPGWQCLAGLLVRALKF